MRTYIVFHQNGEISERICNCRDFDIKNFSNYDHYKKYERYIVLYNDDVKKNLTKLFFTEDIYYGEIAVIKLNKHGIMIDFKESYYTKKILKYKLKSNDLYYSSEEELLSYESLRL